MFRLSFVSKFCHDETIHSSLNCHFKKLEDIFTVFPFAAKYQVTGRHLSLRGHFLSHLREHILLITPQTISVPPRESTHTHRGDILTQYGSPMTYFEN